MTLKETNYEVERLENELNKLINDKILLESTVMPKSTNFEKILVDGGQHGNPLEIYILKQDLSKWQNLDRKIKITQRKIQNNVDWIERELRILKKYNKIEQLIVYYKEVDIKEYTWFEISALVHYSITQCRRIYSKYKKRRNTED